MVRNVMSRHWLLLGALVLGVLFTNSRVSFAVPPSDPLATSGRETSVPATGPSIIPLAAEARPSFRTARADGENAVVVLLADFPDLAWTTTPGDYTTVMNSVADFYATQSGGQLTIIPTVASDGAGDPVVLRASQNLAYYGGNDGGGKDGRPREFFSEIVLLADEQIAGLDFADYDAVIIVHAGPGEDQAGVSDNQLWSVRVALSSSVEVDEVMITGGCIVPEYYNSDISVVGTISHEFAHELGLPDLYDTATRIPVVGYWALMGAGNWVGDGASPAPFSAWSRIWLGWESPVILDSVGTTYNVDRFGSVDAVIYRVNLHGGGDDLEYFLIENRQATADTLDEGLPGSGILIWHVDMSAALEPDPTDPRFRRWERNTVNNGAVRMITLEEADGEGNLLLAPSDVNANRGEASDPFYDPNNTAFTDGSSPNSQDNDGETSFISLTEIPVSGDTMSFLYGDVLKFVDARLVAGGTEMVVRFNKPVQGPSVLLSHFRLLHVTEDADVAGIQPIRSVVEGDVTEILLEFPTAIDDSEVWALWMQGFSAVAGDPLYPTDPSCATLPCPAFVTNPLGTNVPGILSVDEAWTEAGSPYYLAQDAFVAYGITLEIDPGTIIRVADTVGADDWPSAAVDFVINGRVVAEGTAGSPILIESANRSGERAAGDWGTMYFSPHSNAAATFEYVQIRHGGNALDTLYLARDNVSLVDSVIEYSSIEVSPSPRILSAAVRIGDGVSATVQRCDLNFNVIAIRASNSGLVDLDGLEIIGGEFGVSLSGASQMSVSRSEFRAISVAVQANDTASIRLVQSFFDSNTAGALLNNTSHLSAWGNLFDGHISRVMQMSGSATVDMIGNGFTNNALVFGNFGTSAYAIDHNYYSGNLTRASSADGSPAVTMAYDLQHIIDYQFDATSLTFRDPTYSSVVDFVAPDDQVYIQVDGVGASSETNGSVVTLVSDIDPTGIVVHLVETGSSSNIYRVDNDPETHASNGATTSQDDYRIGASSSITATSSIPDEPSDTVVIDPEPVLTTTGNQSIQETETATINVSCVDPESQSVTVEVIEQPDGATFEAGVWSWTTDYTDAGTHTVTFQCDDGNHIVTVSDSVVVSNLNRLPTVTTDGDQNVNELQTADIDASCTDLDLDDELTFEVTVSPAGSSFDAGTWSWTTDYDDAGTHTITFSCSDGTDTVTEDDTVTVNNVNRVPVLTTDGDQTDNEGETVTIGVSCTDPDGEMVTVENTVGPAAATFVGLTWSWETDYDDDGVYTVTFTCADAADLVSESDQVTINDFNPPPMLTTDGPVTVVEEETATINVSCTDPEEESVTLTNPSGPAAATFVAGVWTWVTVDGDEGGYTARFECADGPNTAIEDVPVTVLPNNVAPVLTTSGDLTVNRGDTAIIDVTCTDPDEDTVSLENTAGPAAATFFEGTWSWTVDAADEGEHTVTFECSDTEFTTIVTNTVTVTNINRRPSFEPLRMIRAPSNQITTVDVVCTDPDGDEVTLSAERLPTFAEFDSELARLTLTPSHENVGVWDQGEIHCSDPEPLTRTADLTISVTRGNNTPIADAGGSQVVIAGEVFELDGSASSDPDGDDDLTYLWSQVDTEQPQIEIDQPTEPQTTAAAPDIDWEIVVQLLLEVSDGTNLATDVAFITIVDRDCSYPIAVSGDDQAIAIGADQAVTIYLDGRASYASDTSQLSYHWTQIDGPTVDLIEPHSALPSFDLAGPIGEETYSFGLVVRAVGGPCAGLESGRDLTTVLVLADLNNSAPVADAGADDEGVGGEVLILDGAGSSDPDSDTLTYLWSQSNGSLAILSQPTLSSPAIELPWVSATEELEFVLVVHDGFINSVPDTVFITVLPADQPPDSVDRVEDGLDAGQPDLGPDTAQSDGSLDDVGSDSAEPTETPLPTIGELPAPTGCCALTIGPPHFSSKALGLLILTGLWVWTRRGRGRRA